MLAGTVLALGIAAPPSAADPASYSTAVLSQTPTAYWRLGEPSGTTVTDTSGNGYAGAYNSGTLGAPGAIWNDADTAATFSGSDSSYASISSMPGSFGSGSFSVGFWVQTTATSGVLLSKVADSGFYSSDELASAGWALTIDSSGTQDHTGSVDVQISDGETNQNGVVKVDTGYTTNDVVVNDGDWHFVVVAFDKTNGNINTWIDGHFQQNSMTHVGEGTTANSGAVEIGTSMAGTLEEVALYGSALAGTDVETDLAAAHNQPPASIGLPNFGVQANTGAWTFYEPDGSTFAAPTGAFTVDAGSISTMDSEGTTPGTPTTAYWCDAGYRYGNVQGGPLAGSGTLKANLDYYGSQMYAGSTTPLPPHVSLDVNVGNGVVRWYQIGVKKAKGADSTPRFYYEAGAGGRQTAFTDLGPAASGTAYTAKIVRSSDKLHYTLTDNGTSTTVTFGQLPTQLITAESYRPDSNYCNWLSMKFTNTSLNPNGGGVATEQDAPYYITDKTSNSWDVFTHTS